MTWAQKAPAYVHSVLQPGTRQGQDTFFAATQAPVLETACQVCQRPAKVERWWLASDFLTGSRIGNPVSHSSLLGLRIAFSQMSKWLEE